MTPISDSIIGTDFRDQLEGTGEADVILGASGNDTLKDLPVTITWTVGRARTTSAEARATIAFLDDWNDRLNGQEGDDLIDGGLGNDELSGGGGSNTFVFRPGYGNDPVVDFVATGSDFVEIAETTFETFADLEAAGAVAQIGDNVVVTLGTDMLTINSATFATIGDDFRFV